MYSSHAHFYLHRSTETGVCVHIHIHYKVLLSTREPSLMSITSETGNATFSPTIFTSLPACKHIQLSSVPTIGSVVIVLMSSCTVDDYNYEVNFECHRHCLQVQSNLRRKDTLGAGLLSFVRRLSLSRKFTHISLFNVKKNSF